MNTVPTPTPLPARDAVIVDVDGTLCDVSSIRYLVDKSVSPRRDFHAFHLASAQCPPIASTVEWVAARRQSGAAVIVVTARMHQWADLTHNWLAHHRIAYDALFMRRDNDYRPDVEVKRDIFAHITAAGWRVREAIDDNPAIVNLWRSRGIPTTHVPGWLG